MSDSIGDDKGGLKPYKGADAYIINLEWAQKEVDLQKSKIKQLLFKAERAVERADVKALEAIEVEMDDRKIKLEAAEKKFTELCIQYGLIKPGQK